MEINTERKSQDERWGEQNHPDGTGYPVAIALANMARRKADAHAEAGDLTWGHILEEEFWEALAESDPVRLREELIQVAAVAVAWVEAIDRRTDN